MNHDFHHIFHIHRIREELKEVYENQIIDKFAFSLLMVFIPVYLFIIGYSIAESLLALVITELVTIFLAIPFASVASKLGLKHTILYRIPLAIVFILWLYTMPYMGLNLVNIFIVGLVWGVSRTLYWIPLNSEFVENSDKLHRGEEVGFLLALPVLISIWCPFMGGLVLELTGFPVLFSIYIILMLVSIVPLFLTKEYRKFFQFKMKDLNFRLGSRFNTGFFAQGLLIMGEFLIWPFYTYLTFNNLVSTGIVASLTALGIAFFILLIGRFADRISRSKMLRAGVVGCFFVWVLRYFAATGLEFFILSFLGGIFIVLVRIPIFSSFSDNAKERNILNDVSIREISLSVGRVLIISLMAFTFVGLQLGLILIGLSSLLLLFVKVE
ncbi:MAG: hypothetical protein GTN76_08070 [Candidatus Aenigmarchaeota archaeon]|nr:hypothetical protein [Candidatus Aenigmarchaeota archaeon]